MPNLPKLGIAKHRLRYNVFGILAYLFIWWQGSIYASAKRTLASCLAIVFTENLTMQTISTIGVDLFKLRTSNSVITESCPL